MKVLYFDVETSGLDSSINGIIQLAGIFEVNGNVVETFNYSMKLFPNQKFEQSAFEVHGITENDLKNMMQPEEGFEKFLALLDRHINKFNKDDKFYPSGYNVKFDLEFLNQFFKNNGNNFFGSYCNWRYIDPLPFLYAMDFGGILSLPNYKLQTVCEYYGINIDAHDSFSDIKATKILIQNIIYNNKY